MESFIEGVLIPSYPLPVAHYKGNKSQAGGTVRLRVPLINKATGRQLSP